VGTSELALVATLDKTRHMEKSCVQIDFY
jgi:hypothetical protein